jgi:hypothetical protein
LAKDRCCSGAFFFFVFDSPVSCADSTAAARLLQPLLPSAVLHKEMRSGMLQRWQLISSSPGEQQQGKFVDRGVEEKALN